MKNYLFLIFTMLSIHLFSQEPGNSLNFENSGTPDFITIGDFDDGMNAITIETWILWQQDALQFICGKGNEQFEIHTLAGGNLRFIPTTSVYIDAYHVLPINQWTHIACVYDPAQSLAKIYINGKEVPVIKNGANPVTTPLLNSTGNFYLGIRSNFSYPIKGCLDEFRIWNTARTAEQIYQNYDHLIDYNSQSGLISYYDFNTGVSGGDNTGLSTLTDLKGNYSGTLNNFTLNGSTSNWIGSLAMIKPIALNANSVADSVFTANWIAPITNIIFDNYSLIVSKDSTFSTYVSGYNPKIIPTGQHSEVIDSLQISSNYYYKICVTSNSIPGKGMYSNTIKVKTTNALGNPIWQIGNNLYGNMVNDNFGKAVCISGDGSTLAVGIPGSGDLWTGQTKIYKNINGCWVQIGNDINAESNYDEFGSSVSLNYDGTIVAIGAVSNDNAGGSNSGSVRVYHYISGGWTKMGNDIDGLFAGDCFGRSVSLNNTGDILAVGANESDANGNNSGQVRIFQFIAGNWTQVGNSINGETAEDWDGYNVSLSDDGTTVAISGHRNGGFAYRAGHARVFRNIAGVWTQIGNDFDGESAEEYSGFCVSLNHDGSIVSIGSPSKSANGVASGQVRVFQFIDNSWVKLGNDLNGDGFMNYFGYSLSLNYNGDVLAIGAYTNSDNGIYAGKVKIYKYRNNNWQLIGSDIKGEIAQEYFGYSVSLSDDGSVVAVGAFNNNVNGSGSGRVGGYNICLPKNPPTPDNISLPTINDECSVTISDIPTAKSDCGKLIFGTTLTVFPITTQGADTIIWTFTDEEGNTSTQEQIVIIDDNTNPVTPILPDITAECSTIVTPPTTTDNCAGTITGTTTDSLEYTEQGTYTITWNFDDGNGNLIIVIQNVIIDDISDPVTPTLSDITGECSATVIIPTTTDNCSGIITGITTDSLNYNTQGAHVVHWTFDDGNGNSISVNQNVIIDDLTPPSIPTLPNIYGECNITVTPPTTIDNCGIVTGTTEDPLTYTEQGTYSIEWWFEDQSDNFIVAFQNVIVDDITNPTINCVSNQTYNLLQGQTYYTVSGTELDPTATADNCGIENIENDFNHLSTLAGAHIPVGLTTIVWTITDIGENTNSCSFNVQVNFYAGIKESENPGFSVYPNPTTGKVLIKSEIIKINHIEITDITGKTIETYSNLQIYKSENFQIDMSIFGQGIYLLKLETENGVFVEKIIKE